MCFVTCGPRPREAPRGRNLGCGPGRSPAGPCGRPPGAAEPSPAPQVTPNAPARRCSPPQLGDTKGAQFASDEGEADVTCSQPIATRAIGARHLCGTPAVLIVTLSKLRLGGHTGL